MNDSSIPLKHYLVHLISASALLTIDLLALTVDQDDNVVFKIADNPTFRDDFDPGWETSQTSWQRANYLQNGAQMDPDRCKTDGAGILEQTLLAGGPPYFGGSMQSQAEYGWGRWTARLKPSSVPGALDAFFIKDWDDSTTGTAGDGTRAEVDFEFVTSRFGTPTSEVLLSVHFDDSGTVYSEYIELDFDPSDSYRIWGFDVLPDRVIWHVDGVEIATYKYPANQYVNENYEVLFNTWTNDTWISGPTAQDAVFQIDWVQFQPLEKAFLKNVYFRVTGGESATGQ